MPKLKLKNYFKKKNLWLEADTVISRLIVSSSFFVPRTQKVSGPLLEGLLLRFWELPRILLEHF